MPRSLVLITVTGPQQGLRYTIEGRSATIGSGPTCDVSVNDRSVALRHAELRQMLDRWFVVPLVAGQSAISVNGSPINGQSRINKGDRLTIGNVSFDVNTIEFLEHEVGAPPPSSTPTSGLPRLGDYFVRRGQMSLEQVTKTALRQSELEQRGMRVPFGQVAFELGYINRRQLDNALAEQQSDFEQRFS